MGVYVSASPKHKRPPNYVPSYATNYLANYVSIQGEAN